MSRIKEIITAFTKLGFTSFGGPVAHMSFFRAEFVEKRKWLSESEYADLVALCQFLPGPSSSQVGFGLGVQRAGLLGGLAAFICFTLPSAIYLDPRSALHRNTRERFWSRAHKWTKNRRNSGCGSRHFGHGYVAV